ncbi:putative Oligopeptide transporter, partial [Operophtera brumata]
MSSRQIRRLMAEREQRQRELKTEEEEEEEKVNEEPAATFSPYVVHTNLAFDGLEVSSSSECELSVQSGHQDELDVPDEDKYGAKKKTSSNTKNNKKKKPCYRTALELGKLLLNLDPSDPLAVIFIIDTLAIRAREYQWLLDLIEYWRETRQANSLFHMRYSRALAMFQLARKNKDYDGIESASRVLTKAIKYFPPVAAMMMDSNKKTKYVLCKMTRNHPTSIFCIIATEFCERFSFCGLRKNQHLQGFFSTFYCTVNLGGLMGMIITPALRRSVMCFGDDTCYALGFGFPAVLVPSNYVRTHDTRKKRVLRRILDNRTAARRVSEPSRAFHLLTLHRRRHHLLRFKHQQAYGTLKCRHSQCKPGNEPIWTAFDWY